jgi:DNA repair exonuclease SbcCD ATPase subunit
MTQIRRVLISGFRGILTPLEIDLVQGSRCESVILYGANGTGKSSITDAWEWLSTGRIQHLAREGAEEGAYPHISAKPGTSYVEVEFSDAAVGVVRLEYDHTRITKPKSTGNLSQARRLITHPCHIRYGDLTRFVFLRKADRYDALASLMGFVPQMEYQKALRRVQTNFERDVSQLEVLKQDADIRFKTHFNVVDVDVSAAYQQIAQLCQSHGIKTAPTAEAAKTGSQQLQNLVAQDPKAKRLADYRSLETALRASTVSEDLTPDLSALRDAVGRVKAAQKEHLTGQLLVPLFQAADELLSKVDTSGACPLCGQPFSGDLREHVKTELAKVRHLQELLDHLKRCREKISETLATQKALAQTFEANLDTAKPEVKADLIQGFRSASQAIDACLGRVRELLVFDSTSIGDQLVASLKGEEDSLRALIEPFATAKSELLEEAQTRKDALDQDPARLALVADAQFIATGLSLLHEIETKLEKLNSARGVLTAYSAVVNDYVGTCLTDVQKRFDEISENVRVYFELLERHTQGLGAPKLKLLPDQDRSVVLEVVFHGNAVNPAYKYLSESQLNSFGLAVFLASATHFNKECQFLILDDVVNSFDSYKRPLLIDLIKNHLQGRQIVLLTHDRFWRELLHRTLPSWKRVDFAGYDFGVGPTMVPGVQTLDRVANALDRDEPDEACRILAQYMEDVLQDIGERFECEVKFNRRNEYTLDTLLDRVRVRVQDKLKADHPLTKAVVDLLAANAYRNWTTHCKNPQSSIHKYEVEEVLAKWKAIESQVICPEAKCFEIVSYDGKGAFSCPCGKTRLTKGS